MRPRTFITATILLFWGTMMGLQVQYEYLQLGQEAAKDPTYARQEFSDFLTRDDQVVFLIQDEDRQTIGDMERNLLQKSPEIVTEQKISLNLSALVDSKEEQGQLRVNNRSTFDQQGELQSFKIRFHTTNDQLQSIVSKLLPAGEFVITGERTDGKIKVWFGTDQSKQPSLINSLFDMSSSFHPMGNLKPPEPGKTQTTRVTNPLQNGMIEVDIHTSASASPIIWQNQEVEAHRVTIRSRQESKEGVRGHAWITRSGDLLRQKIQHPLVPFDLRFLRTTPIHQKTSNPQ